MTTLAGREQNEKHPLRVSGGFVLSLVFIGFLLVMLLTLPNAWPLFALLVGIGAGIAFWMESREAMGFPNKMDSEHTDIEAEGRSRIFGPDMHIEWKPTITSHPVGIVLIIGLGLVLLGRVPLFLPFLLGAVALGAVIGAVLWWKHR
ncbi:MAG: hypothetical protein M1453_03090 [Acidobacteria bacterium]|nr:hypothetical protein [Acidobacteriota bacterium]MCL5286966.1 hypothetical protein [Acidobacteriota bacterium]